MLAEAINYSLTLATMVVKNPVMARSAVTLWARAQRCRKAWEPHEVRTKAHIKIAADRLALARTVVVLGSGMLRDIPIEHLAARFRKVVLVDLVHLASTKVWLKWKRFDNIVLIERDLSGFAALNAGLQRGEALDAMDLQPLAFLQDIPDVDLVVSANLLSQIGIGAEDSLYGDSPVALTKAAVQKLLRAHLSALAALPCPICLITDTGFVTTDRAGNILEQQDLLHGVDPGAARDEWDWLVVPFGEESREYQSVHRVIAV